VIATPKAAHVWERDPNDWYVEGTRATVQLLAREAFPGWTHDPCCGQGNIVRTLIAAGLTATGSDLVQRVAEPWHMGVADFLDGPMGCYGADNCVMNPPFYRAVGAERAIRRALECVDGKVAVFTGLRFLAGSGRSRGLYHDHPPSTIYQISPRPSCPPGTYLLAGGKAEGDTQDYVWLVWDERPARRDAGALSAHGWLT